MDGRIILCDSYSTGCFSRVKLIALHSLGKTTERRMLGCSLLLVKGGKTHPENRRTFSEEAAAQIEIASEDKLDFRSRFG